MWRSSTLAGFVMIVLVAAMVLVPTGFAQSTPKSTGDSVDVMIDGADDLAVNTTTTATITIEGATNGISAYELALELEDDTATIGDIDVLAEGDSGPMTDIERSDDNTMVTIGAALLEATHEPAAEMPIVDVELEGQTNGTATVTVAEVSELSDLDVDPYAIGTTGDMTVRVGAGETDDGSVGDEPAVSPPSDDKANEIDGNGTDADAASDSASTSQTDELRPETQSRLELEGIQFPTTAAPGETVMVEATITNDGEARTAQLTYTLADEQTATDVTVGSNATVTAALEMTVPERATGDLEQLVAIASDERESKLELRTGSSATDGEPVPGFGAIGAMVALAVGARTMLNV